MSKKNDSGIVYSLIYNNLQSKFEWKIGKKNEWNFDWRIVYSLIYNDLQSKFDWKMSQILTEE